MLDELIEKLTLMAKDIKVSRSWWDELDHFRLWLRTYGLSEDLVYVVNDLSMSHARQHPYPPMTVLDAYINKVKEMGTKGSTADEIAAYLIACSEQPLAVIDGYVILQYPDTASTYRADWA